MDNHIMHKPKKRWSAMDTVILLLVLVAVAGLVYRVVYAARKDAEADPTMYRVYFEVLETHENVLAEVEGFDAVYLYENDTRLGYIGVYLDTATGILICNNATVSAGGGLMVGDSGRYLTPGSVLEVRTDRVLMTIRITSVREHT